MPGKYEVSSGGKVRNSKTGRILKARKNTCGYFQVALSKHNKKQMFSVHRLAANAFIPNPNNYTDVNHKNENKHDNRVENLEWCTREANINHGTCRQRMSEAKRGAKHPQAKKVRCVETGQVFDTVTEAATEFGISTGNICKCCKGVYKQTGGFHWEYVKES